MEKIESWNSEALARDEEPPTKALQKSISDSTAKSPPGIPTISIPFDGGGKPTTKCKASKATVTVTVRTSTDPVKFLQKVQKLNRVKFFDQNSCCYTPAVDESNAGVTCRSATWSVSDCSSLKVLSLPHCYDLESMSLSGCLSLESLSLSSCYDLKSLSLSDCPSLESLSLSSCYDLKSLSLSDCPSLESLSFSDCYDLKSLSISNCPSLDFHNLPKWHHLESLFLSHCPFLKLHDLPNCYHLESLSFSHCPSLESLSLSDCYHLESLSFSHCPSLESLSLSDCYHLESLSVSHCPSLESLSLSDCYDLKSLSISNCPSLKLHDLPHCSSLKSLSLGDSHSLELHDLPECYYLESLSISHCSSLESLSMLPPTTAQKFDDFMARPKEEFMVYSLPFVPTNSNENKDNSNDAVKVYTRRDLMEIKQPATFAELGNDPENTGIISDLLSFVSDKEFYKRKGKAWKRGYSLPLDQKKKRKKKKRGYLLCNSPGTDRSCLITAMANCLEFDVYELDLTGVSSISELTNVLVSISNRSLIAIKDVDRWLATLPNLKNESTISGLSKIIHSLLSSCGDEQIIVLTANNHIERVDAALLRHLNNDLYIHMSSPQPKAVPEGGEILLLDSSEIKPSVGFYATNNRAYQSDVPVSNSEDKSTREASRRQCMPEGALSLVPSMAGILWTDSDASDNKASRSGPIGFNLEKKDTEEGLRREWCTESVFSLDDSTEQKSLSDAAVTEKKSHLVRAYRSGADASLSDDKLSGDALRRECITKSMLGLEDLPQHCGGRRDAAAKSLCGKLLEDLLQQHYGGRHYGGRHVAAAKSFCGIHTTDSLARISLEVLETHLTKEQPNDCIPLLSLGRLALEDCVEQEKSPDLPRDMQINGVDRRVTKLPGYLEGLTAQSASSSCWPIGVPDGGHIELFDPLDQSTTNLQHAAWADQCSPTVSLAEKKMMRKTLKRMRRTMSMIIVEKHQHFATRWKGNGKSLSATYIFWKHGINQLLPVKQIHKQHRVCQWPFQQSAIGLPYGGCILRLSVNKIARNTLKRKFSSMSGQTLEYHKQHVGRRCEDAAKSNGERIRRQLVIHRLSTSKCIHKQHGVHRWPIQPSANGIPDGGHILPLSEKTLKRKRRSTSVHSLEDRQEHVDSRWEDAAKNIGAKRIYGQLVIHGDSIAKRICRQHWIHNRWPFYQDWATMKGTMKGCSSGDEQPVEVISLHTHVKLILRIQLICISWLGRFSTRPSSLAEGGNTGGPGALSLSEPAASKNKAHHVGQDLSGSDASDSEHDSGNDSDETYPIFTSNDHRLLLKQLYRKVDRTEAAKTLGVSVSKFKRICRKCQIERWPHVTKKKRPPDRHGGTSTSIARETPSHNVQTGIQGEPVRHNREADEFRRASVDSSILLNKDGLIVVLKVPDPHESNTSQMSSSHGQTEMQSQMVGLLPRPNEHPAGTFGGPVCQNTGSSVVGMLEPPTFYGACSGNYLDIQFAPSHGQKEMMNQMVGLLPGPNEHLAGNSGGPFCRDTESSILETPPFHGAYSGNYLDIQFALPHGQKEMENQMVGLLPGPNEHLAGAFGGQFCRDSSILETPPFHGAYGGSYLDASQQMSQSTLSAPCLEGHGSRSSNGILPTCFDPVLTQPSSNVSHTLLMTSHMMPPLATSLDTHERNTSQTCEAIQQTNQSTLSTLSLSHLEGHGSASSYGTMPTSSNPVLTQPFSNVSRMVPTTLLNPSQDTSSVEVKATYGDEIVRFWFPCTSGIIELKDKVATRLDLNRDSFSLKYKDDEQDLVSISCNEDLRNYLQLFSSSTKPVKLFVVDKGAKRAAEDH